MPSDVRLLTSDERVLVGVVRGCYLAGRRRRPGERVLVLRDEARFALADQVVELLPGERRSAPPRPRPLPDAA